MARNRQQAKQRKAKKLAQEKKAAERAKRKDENAEKREERLEEIEAEGLGRESMEGTGIAAEVALDQAKMDADLAKQADLESAAPAEAAEGEAEAAAPAEAAKAADETAAAKPAKKTRRQRREEAAARAAEQADKPAKKEAKPAKRKQQPQDQGKKAKRAPRERGRVLNFFVQVWAELKRVQWPTRDQVLQATGVVIAFCIIAGLYLAFWDFIWTEVVDRVF